VLDKIGDDKREKRPSSFRDWQRMFDEIYISDDANDKQKIFGRLAEELGELAEAIRLIPVSYAYFMNEAVDVFAWLMRYANYEEGENREEVSKIGESVELALWEEYPGKCRHCGEEVCKCPAILVESLGRISREMPTGAYSGSKDIGLFSYEEKIEIFRLGDRALLIGGKQYELTTELLEEIIKSSNLVLQQINEMNTKIPKSLESALLELKNLASQQTVTQKNIDALSDALEKSSPETRTMLLDFFTGIGAGLWTEAIKLMITGMIR